MNAISKDSSHLAWLFARLGAQRARLVDLLQRLTVLGMPGAMKPSIFRKFLNMLDQVAAAKTKENSIISRIETIEAKHRFQRNRKGLKYAAPEPKPEKDQNFEYEDEPECERPPAWLWILALVVLLSGRRINQKKQGLTAD